MVLGIFAPVLILTGVAGLLLPPDLSPMSGAVPYDVFHIVFGVLGLVIVLTRSARWAARFNLGFGAIDLYLAIAGLIGIFPSEEFGLRLADLVAHVAVGALLVVSGSAVIAKSTWNQVIDRWTRDRHTL